ncbi:MAG: flagellar basal body rod protein FlgC [Gammaproteobacteria bacterium]|nr:flagellar basal body rod protein FlgC [Gammaproteobacteria bacterium]MDP2139343.1 flagellar basal body rod protein FlgC [Gammaproteobacteria bacterium]MDP2346900.1 flagellar basal body rod protein FlgC [Gammaproteobacteria bacterium]
MSLMNIFDISGSAMSAQSIRLSTTASNMANGNSAARSAEETYKARYPIFSAVQTRAQAAMQRGDFAANFAESNFATDSGMSVQVLGIVESNRPLQPRYEPEHPLADDDGYVFYPDVNIVEEMTNMISSSRSFQMNVDVMNAARSMMQRVLSLGQ